MALFAVLALVWQLSSISDLLSPEQVTTLFQTMTTSAWGVPAVLLAFVLGSLVAFPVTVLIVATAVAFGAWGGFVWSLVGALLGAVANFAVGRWLGRRMLARWAGDRVNNIAGRLARGGIVAVVIMRNVPVAPFAVMNTIAGATPLRLRDYVIGTVLGMSPGIAAVTFLGDRLHAVWEQPTTVNLSLLALGVALWIGLAIGLQSLSNRLAKR